MNQCGILVIINRDWKKLNAIRHLGCISVSWIYHLSVLLLIRYYIRKVNFSLLECSLPGYNKANTYTHGTETKYYPDCIYENTVTLICQIMAKDSSMGNRMYKVNCKKHVFLIVFYFEFIK
jgi:hypothetical protein